MSRIGVLKNDSAAAPEPVVIAIHCSGSSGTQWRSLACRLGDGFTTWAPDLIGHGSMGNWKGEHAFTLSDEATQIVRMVDSIGRPVHLVGHSYGGAVALRVARERASRIASLVLYEPAAFDVLRTASPEGNKALAEIRSLAAEIGSAVLAGSYVEAAEQFVTYWNGEASWAEFDDEVRQKLIRYIPKATLEFRAAICERTALPAYRYFNFPVLLLEGEHTSPAMRIIVRHLARAMKFALPRICAGAGHMGPVTHAEAVSAVIASFMERQETGRKTNSSMLRFAA
jgi:pimeloyl-ACP methyl ester carboxylesterase